MAVTAFKGYFYCSIMLRVHTRNSAPVFSSRHLISPVLTGCYSNWHCATDSNNCFAAPPSQCISYKYKEIFSLETNTALAISQKIWRHMIIIKGHHSEGSNCLGVTSFSTTVSPKGVGGVGFVLNLIGELLLLMLFYYPNACR